MAANEKRAALDRQHSTTSTAVDADSLKKAFTDFLETLGIALATEPREVDDDDPRALWPATEPTDSFGAPLGG